MLGDGAGFGLAAGAGVDCSSKCISCRLFSSSSRLGLPVSRVVVGFGDVKSRDAFTLMTASRLLSVRSGGSTGDVQDDLDGVTGRGGGLLYCCCDCWALDGLVGNSSIADDDLCGLTLNVYLV
jgi:hypothetical protein